MKIIGSIIAFFFVYSEIWIAGILYMRRWRFMPDWLPGFRVHNILQSDDDRALHDHPFSFLTIILSGGYYEYLNDGSMTWHGPGSVLWRPAATLHRIELEDLAYPMAFALAVNRALGSKAAKDQVPYVAVLRPAWTLVFRSRYFREWGFQTKTGWVHNREFVTKREGHHKDEGNAK